MCNSKIDYTISRTYSWIKQEERWMQQIFSNTTLTVNQLIEKIDTGELGLPELQRPFIWKDSKVRDLFDSMMCGYPIGYLMLWECPTLEKKKTIGTPTTMNLRSR